MAARARFNPRAILGALERHDVDYVLIGGLARVLRGTGELTAGVDVCPSFAAANLERLSAVAAELGARAPGGGALDIDEPALGAEPVLTLRTMAGQLNVLGSPAGAPNGFLDLRRGASNEDLGQGLRPLVASTADLARLAAAFSRDRDLARLPELRRIMELEVDRGQTLDTASSQPRRSTHQRARRANRAGR